MDRLGFWVNDPLVVGVDEVLFQYPLMDRLGFWGRVGAGLGAGCWNFSIR